MKHCSFRTARACAVDELGRAYCMHTSMLRGHLRLILQVAVVVILGSTCVGSQKDNVALQLQTSDAQPWINSDWKYTNENAADCNSPLAAGNVMEYRGRPSASERRPLGGAARMLLQTGVKLNSTNGAGCLGVRDLSFLGLDFFMALNCSSASAYTSLLLPEPGSSNVVSFVADSTYCMDLSGNSAADGTSTKVCKLLMCVTTG